MKDKLLAQGKHSSAFEISDADLEWVLRAPTLYDYTQRQHAEMRNFRRFVVPERDDTPDDDGYRRTRVRGEIKLDTYGNVRVSGEVLPPSPDEAAKIAKEILDAKWPTSMPFLKGQRPPRLKGVSPEHVFEYLDEQGTHGLFLQHRQWDSNGAKFDTPWSFWSDSEWRQMEPDGLLPLYGLEQLKSGRMIFVHEGAKTAQYLLRAMQDKHWDHPWAEQLRDSLHLGWPGGADNPNRVDWSPLKRLERDRAIVVVADNDPKGVEAVKKISSLLRRRLEMVRFDNEFPVSFDLSDSFPKHFGHGKDYVGPPMAEMTFPATWATEEIPNANPKSNRKHYKLRPEFAEEWVYSERPEVFIHLKQPERLRSLSEFNKAVRPFSDVANTAALLETHLPSKVDGICYQPRRADAPQTKIITENNQRLCNTYRPSSIRPKPGNAGPWEQYLEYFVPDEGDRYQLKRWIATFIARPEVRMHYSVLLISEQQGVGKTTLCNILSALAGRTNVSCPNEKTIVDSPFNGWVAHKRLAIVNEIYSGHSRKAYDRLKSAITDDEIEVNQKFQTEYKIHNVVHVVACSNSKQAIYIDDGDRRWLVPQVTEEQHPYGTKFWRDFNAWLRAGGLPIIANWADEFLRHDPDAVVLTGAHAPETVAKSEVIDESMSEGQRIAQDLARAAIARQPENIVLIVPEVRDFIAVERRMDPNDPRLEKPTTIRKALRRGGMKEPRRVKGGDPRIKIGKTYKSVVANFDIPTEASWADIKDYHRQPSDLIPSTM